MVYSLSFRLYRQCRVIHFTVIAGLATPLLLSAQLAQANEFGGCSTGLVAAGVKTSAATAACARALHPEQVSNCVTTITSSLKLDPNQVLQACSRDRQVEELASCVTTVKGVLTEASGSTVLDKCRQSVLPQRYAECVTGLVEAIPLAAGEAMTECMAAGQPPTELTPSFIPTR